MKENTTTNEMSNKKLKANDIVELCIEWVTNRSDEQHERACLVVLVEDTGEDYDINGTTIGYKNFISAALAKLAIDDSDVSELLSKAIMVASFMKPSKNK